MGKMGHRLFASHVGQKKNNERISVPPFKDWRLMKAAEKGQQEPENVEKSHLPKKDAIGIIWIGPLANLAL